MNQHSRRAALEREDTDSLFPAAEPASIGTRPTPVVPASDELRTLGTRSIPPEPSEDMLRPSSRPTASFGWAEDFSGGSCEPSPSRDVTSLAPELGASSLPRDVDTPHAAPRVTSSTPLLEISSSTPLPEVSSLPPRGALRRRPRVRRLVAKLLFIALFGGVAALLVMAAQKKLQAAPGALDSAGLVDRLR